MARARTKASIEPDEDRWGAPEWLLRESAALVTGGVSIFVLLALAAEPWTGNVGGMLAGPLRKTFGGSSYVLPAAGLYAAVQILRHRRPWSTGRWASCLGAMIFGAILMELVGVAEPRAAGGIFGEFVGLAVLRENFGSLGSYCLVLPLFTLSVLGLTATSMREISARLRGTTSAVLEWSRERRAEREASPEVEPEIVRPVRVHRENVRREREREPETERKMRVIVPERAPEPKGSKKAKLRQEAFTFAGGFRLPALSFLDDAQPASTRIDREGLEARGEILEAKLQDFQVQGHVGAIHPGPVITTYEFEPAPGVKVSKIVGLADDLSMALRAMSVRILAPIPGKAVVGIEVSNPVREQVTLREIIESPEFGTSAFRIPLVLGKDSVGKPVVADLTRMPHLLVAGATGTGKSVSLNAMIMSILYKASPEDVRLLMIDPKMLELSLYEDIPHLLTRVVTDPKESAAALSRAVVEMESRYRLLKDKGVRNIDSYNRVLEQEAEGKSGKVVVLEEPEPEPESDDDGWTLGDPSFKEELVHRKLPYIIVIIDELADLMMTTGRQVEEYIIRLAQKARAAGIHLIVATQRPSVDVITGLIKANFPARVSFQVSSRIDSRTILDSIGAERLLGEGDMLFSPPGTARLTRVHGAFVSEREVRKVTDFVREQAAPAFDEEFTRALEEAGEDGAAGDLDDEDADEKYEEAIELLGQFKEISTSKLQRHLRIGYNRAARMIERMEREGRVGPADGARPREVLAHHELE